MALFQIKRFINVKLFSSDVTRFLIEIIYEANEYLCYLVTFSLKKNQIHISKGIETFRLAITYERNFNLKFKLYYLTYK